MLRDDVAQIDILSLFVLSGSSRLHGLIDAIKPIGDVAQELKNEMVRALLHY